MLNIEKKRLVYEHKESILLKNEKKIEVDFMIYDEHLFDIQNIVDFVNERGNEQAFNNSITNIIDIIFGNDLQFFKDNTEEEEYEEVVYGLITVINANSKVNNLRLLFEEPKDKEKLYFILNDEDKKLTKYKAIDVLILIKILEVGDLVKLNRWLLDNNLKEYEFLFADRWNSTHGGAKAKTFDYFRDMDLIINEFDIFNRSWFEFVGFMEKTTLIESAISKRMEFRSTNIQKMAKEQRSMYQKLKNRYKLEEESMTNEERGNFFFKTLYENQGENK